MFGVTGEDVGVDNANITCGNHAVNGLFMSVALGFQCFKNMLLLSIELCTCVAVAFILLAFPFVECFMVRHTRMVKQRGVENGSMITVTVARYEMIKDIAQNGSRVEEQQAYHAKHDIAEEIS